MAREPSSLSNGFVTTDDASTVEFPNCTITTAGPSSSEDGSSIFAQVHEDVDDYIEETTDDESNISTDVEIN